MKYASLWVAFVLGFLLAAFFTDIMRALAH